MAELALVLCLLVVAASTFPSFGLSFTDVDETRNIARGRYFWTTFVDRDLSGVDWQPNYQVLTHPPVGRYLLGLGLAMQGWSPERLNRYADAELSSWMVDAAFFQVPVDAVRTVDWTDGVPGVVDDAARTGGWPTADLLAAARRVALVLALGALLALYLLTRQLDGPIAAIVVVVLALINPLLAALWTHALLEGPFALFSLLAVWLALRAAHRAGGERVDHRAALWLGATLGIASATKLTAVLGVAGLFSFAFLQVASRVWMGLRSTGLKFWCLAFVVTVLTFVAVNPFLYVDPIGRSIMLFRYRLVEMSLQQAFWPDQTMPSDILTRTQVIAESVSVRFSSWRATGLPPMDGALAVFGFGLSLVRSGRELLVRRTLGAPTLWICWVMAICVGTTAGMPMRWQQYYVPLVTISVILQALAVARCLSWGACAVRMHRR